MAALTAVMIALLAMVVWFDISVRIIPDLLCLAIGGLGLVLRLQVGLMPVVYSVGIAALLFLALLLVHSRGLVGGGDVKLLTALAIGLSPLDSYRLLMATAIFGGVLGLVYLVLRRAQPRMAARGRGHGLLARIAATEVWRMRRGGPLPYGVAIATAACLVLLQPEG